MNSAVGPRYPFEPLRDFVARMMNKKEFHIGDNTGTGLETCLSTAARVLYYRGKKQGWLSTQCADHMANEMGKHPFDIWGWAWFEGAALEPRCFRCGEFVPWAPRGRGEAYCSDDCRYKARQVRKKQAREAERGAA